MRIESSVELLHPQASEWVLGPQLPSARIGASMGALRSGESVWIAGGMADELASDVLVLDPQANLWRNTAALSLPLYLSGHARAGDAWLVAGGLTVRNGELHAVAASWLVWPDEGRVESVGALPCPIAEPSLLMLSDGSVLLVGGYDHEALGVVAHFDPDRLRWHAWPPLPSPRVLPTLMQLDARRVAVLGGAGSLDNAMSHESFVLDLEHRSVATTCALQFDERFAIQVIDDGVLVAVHRDRVEVWSLDS